MTSAPTVNCLIYNCSADKDLTRTGEMIPARIPTGFESAKIDFRIAALVACNGEYVVCTYVEADVVEPAVETVAERIAQCNG